MLVRLAGKNILFDPTFSPRASPVSFAGPKCVVPLPIDIPELPRIDVVMISHNHYDHLDADSVQRLVASAHGSPRFLVPKGLAVWFRELGIMRVDEYDWWQEARDGPLRITFVPVQHWSRRGLKRACETSAACSHCSSTCSRSARRAGWRKSPGPEGEHTPPSANRMPAQVENETPLPP